MMVEEGGEGRKRGPLYRATLALSFTINVILLVVLADRFTILARLGRAPLSPLSPSAFCTWPTWLPDLRPAPEVTAKATNAQSPRFPRFVGRLTHTMFVLQDSRKELDQLRETLSLWRRFPPCLRDSYPTLVGHSHVALVFYFVSPPRARSLAHLKRIFKALPTEVKQCFAQVEIHHAGLSKLAHQATAGEEREMWRKVFEGLVTNTSRLANLNHALILSTNTRPVQADWLNQVDYHCRPPNDMVWHRGSIYRGLIERPPSEIGTLTRLSPAGLYFFADETFGHFYLDRIRPATKLMNSTDPLLTTGRPVDADRWSIDIPQQLAADLQSKSWYAVAHHFRHANFILDYYGRNVSLALIQRDNPDTVLVTGNLLP